MSKSGLSDLQAWSERQWTGAVVMLFLAQVFLLGVVAEREAAPMVVSPPGGGLEVVQWPVGVEDASRELGVRDPMLFAVPNDFGFSGEAWRMASRSPLPRLEWSEPTRWLSARTNWFGVGLQGPGAGLGSPSVMSGLRVPVGTRVEVPGVALARVSRLELDDGLAARGVQSWPEVPVLSHTNLLQPTWIQVAVEPDGMVFSAVVLKSSGWEEADRQAVALLHGLRLTPESSGVDPVVERLWGNIVVRWSNATTTKREPGQPAGGGAT
ncbi:MAG: hypothetical protein RI897_800 [Verrucomicrobiota bacterium]|jgi:hypothetical protein